MLTERDAKVFYQLLYRYNKVSPNIAILGDSRRFREKISNLTKYCKKNNIPIKLNINKTKLTVMYEDQIVNYIHIEKIDDLTGYYFRKFI